MEEDVTNALVARMDPLAARMDTLAARMGELTARMGRLDSRMSGLEMWISELTESLNRCAARIEHLFNRFSASFVGLD